MKNVEPNHAMIDLETVGTKPDSGIVSIGAVIFDPRYNVVTDKTFYRELDWESQSREIDQACLTEFWDKQPPVIREALNGLDDLEEVLVELAEWLPKDVKVWGNGPTFDISMLEDAYRQYEVEIPWKFWNVRCCRTIKDMYESQRGGFSKKMGGGKHNALQDAIYQAQYVCEMWNKILSGR